MHRSAVKVNDISHNYNFQKENLIYVTYKTPLEAVFLLKMPFYVAKATTLQTTLHNLNDKID